MTWLLDWCERAFQVGLGGGVLRVFAARCLHAETAPSGAPPRCPPNYTQHHTTRRQHTHSLNTPHPPQHTPLPQHTNPPSSNPPSQQDTPLLPHPARAHTRTHARTHLRRDAVLLHQGLLRQVDLQRVVGRQGHAQPAREERRERVLVVVEEERVVGERRHAEADLGVVMGGVDVVVVVVVVMWWC